MTTDLKTPLIPRRVARWLSALGWLLATVGLVSGCASGLLPKPATQPVLFALDASTPELPPMATGATPAKAPGLTLTVDVPRAAAGYDTPQMAYLRRPHEIEYFASHQWVDTPARMLTPQIVQALQRSNAFRAVVMTPTTAAGELRLETELVRLQQDFSQSPSRVRLTLRALLINTASRQVLAAREFDLYQAAASDDPYGGALAANLLVQQLLSQLAAWASSTVGKH